MQKTQKDQYGNVFVAVHAADEHPDVSDPWVLVGGERVCHASEVGWPRYGLAPDKSEIILVSDLICLYGSDERVPAWYNAMHYHECGAWQKDLA
jgi:hypothetical protein